MINNAKSVHMWVSKMYIVQCTLCMQAFICFRAAVERNVLRLREIVPLTPDEMGKSLGPGYKAGVTKSSQRSVELC